MCSLTADVALKRQTNTNQNLKTLWLQCCKYAQAQTLMVDGQLNVASNIDNWPATFLWGTIRFKFSHYLSAKRMSYILTILSRWSHPAETIRIILFTFYTFSQYLRKSPPSPLRVNTAIYRGNSAEAAFTKWLLPVPLPQKGLLFLSLFKMKNYVGKIQLCNILSKLHLFEVSI